MFSATSEFSASQSNLVILFIDYLNTRLTDRMDLRAGMLKYLTTKLKPEQEIAVYGLTERLVLLHPFTRDSSALIAVASNLLKQKGQPRDPIDGKPLIKPEADPIKYASNGTDVGMEFLAAQNARREYNMDQLHRAQRTLQAFRELAESFGTQGSEDSRAPGPCKPPRSPYFRGFGNRARFARSRRVSH